MSNKYKFSHNDRLIEIQYNDKVDDINEDLNNNIRDSFGEIVNTIIENIKNLVLNLGEPTFKNRQADKIFDENDYNKNIKEISNDLQNSFSNINNIQDILKDNFNYSNIYNKQLSKRVGNAGKILNDISTYIDEEDNIYTITEDFNSKDNIDTRKTSAQIMPERGMATLNINDFDDGLFFDENTDVEILDNSNGFPGRMHKLKPNDYIGDSFLMGNETTTKGMEINEHPEFYRSEDPHLHLARAIDGDPGTWFEYETSNFIHDDQVATSNTADNIDAGTKFYGTVYNDGTLWAKDPEGGRLDLTIQITMPEAKTMDVIDILKYRIPYDGYVIPEIHDIKVAPDLESTPESVLDEHEASQEEQIIRATQDHRQRQNIESIFDEDVNDRATITFSKRQVQLIEISFRQPNSYECPIGHVFYEEVVEIETTETSWFGLKSETSSETHTERIPGPMMEYDGLMREANSSLSDLILSGAGGMAGGFAAGAAMGAGFGPAGMIIGGIGGVLGSIWGNTEKEVVSQDIVTGIDVLPGWRYAIAIQNITGEVTTYAESSQIVSKEFTTPGDISKIQLDASEYIPSTFYSDVSGETSYENKDEWIQYYFSLNNSDTWHKISPNESYTSDIPTTYYINTDYENNLDNKDDTKYIELDQEANSIKFKTVLKRPTTIDATGTPRLNSYSYNITIDGDIYEY